MRNKRKIAALITCVILFFSACFIYAITRIGYFQFETYYENIGMPYTKDSLFRADASIIKDEKDFTASIAVSMLSKSVDSIVIDDICFNNVSNEILYTSNDSKSVYDSSIEGYVTGRYIVSTDNYLNFYFTNLVLPRKITIKVDYSYGNNKNSLLIAYKRKHRFFFVVP